MVLRLGGPLLVLVESPVYKLRSSFASLRHFTPDSAKLTNKYLWNNRF